MDEREQSDEYELIRHDQADHLRREVELLKGDPFIKNHSTNKLLVAVQNLTESIQHLYSLFENVQNELLEEGPIGKATYIQSKNLSEEKLDKLLEQNKHIAKGILSLANILEDHEQIISEHSKRINMPQQKSFSSEPIMSPLDSKIEKNAEQIPDFSEIPVFPQPHEIDLSEINTEKFDMQPNLEMPSNFQEIHELPKFTQAQINTPEPKPPQSNPPKISVPNQNQNTVQTPKRTPKPIYQNMQGIPKNKKPQPLFDEDIKIDLPNRSLVTHLEPQTQPNLNPPPLKTNQPSQPQSNQPSHMQQQNQVLQQPNNIPYEFQEKKPLNFEQVNMYPASVDPFIHQTKSAPNNIGRTQMPIQGQQQFPPPNISRSKPLPNPFAADLESTPYSDSNPNVYPQLPNDFIEPNYPKPTDFPGTNLQSTIGPPIDDKPSRKKFLGLF